MLSSFCCRCSVAVDWGVLFTNNSSIVLDWEVVGPRPGARLHLDAVTLHFLPPKKNSWILDFKALFSFQLSLFHPQWSWVFSLISCAFCLISSTFGGCFVKGDAHPKWNGCSWIDELSLAKGGSLALFCSVISSVASVASLAYCWRKLPFPPNQP